MNNKIAFIKIRSRHTSIEQIILILRKSFPEHELEIIDIKKLLLSNIHVVIINIFHMLYVYGIGTLFHGKGVIYNRFFGTLFMYRNIKRILNDVIRSKYLFTIQDCSLFNGKLVGIPHFVYTDHTVLANKNYPEFNPSLDLLSAEWIRLEREIYHDADLVFTCSMVIRESVINEYICEPDKVKCIYYAPFDSDENAKVNPRKYSTKNILFVGMEWERKGGPILIQAFKRVLEEVPDAKLTIIGCRPIVNCKNVEIIGPIPKDMLWAYYDRCAVFCLPTRREPFGIVFIEAMRYSLPIIGTNIGAIPELIVDGDSGYLIQINDVEYLASLLIALLLDPAKCELMGQRGFENYRKRFSMDVVSSALKNYISPVV